MGCPFLKGEKMRRELELYIHIPFCVKKCAYCDFLSGPASDSKVEEYVRALVTEIGYYQEFSKKYEVSTVFFGGGTPSLLTGEQMQRIMDALRQSFSFRETVEITMEANPGTVTVEKLRAYQKAGINRLSFGLQSVNNEELKLLGRIHTYEEFLESYEAARNAGFQNINVDLISAIPKQTIRSWEQTLQTIIRLQPEHISAYSLIVEEGTPFAKLYGEGCEMEHLLPTEEEERRMYERTEELLWEAGYHRYEISNYAKVGYECEHNLGYWERKEYLGLGLGASSLIEETRFSNTEVMEEYLQNVKNPQLLRKGQEGLDRQEQMEEFVFLGLRKMKGIREERFADLFGEDIWNCYGDNLKRMIQKGLLEKEEGALRLTRKGIDISNYVFAEILSED